MPSALAPRGRVPRRSTEAPGLPVPLFLLNLKSYPSTAGERGLAIGRALARLGRERSVNTALAAAAADLGWFAHELDLPVLAQHTDAARAGAATGWIVPECLALSGVRGSLVNHSEHPLRYGEIRTTLSRLRANRLTPVLCARSPAAVRALLSFRPPLLAIEPPELIGGARSVSTARPEVISQTVELARRLSPRTRVLCGAGIHDRNDVRRALELGSEGILVASAVALSPDPPRAIRELLAGFGAIPDG